jgi:hypothetical protein
MQPLFRTLAAAALAACTVPALAQGRIVQARGDVQVEGRAAAAGQPFAGGSVRTGADGQVQIVMADNTLLALPPSSELQWQADRPTAVILKRGGLRIDATFAPAGWRIEMPERSVLTNGFLKLVPCAEGCALAPGLYGRIVQGEAALEYQGGRSLLRNRAFLWATPATRPEVLAIAPALLDDAPSFADAERVRQQASENLRRALEAFGTGDDAVAAAQLAAVRDLVPGEPLVDYYLGLIALRREDQAEALRLLQQYARSDPDGAAARDVPKTLTLLSSSQLQQEVATALARETQVAGAAPEPNSIAVQAFVNRGNDAYRALAKGIAAMIIADLDKVPGLKVLEREKVQVLIDEMKLGDSGLADPASAVRSGRLMRAEKVIVGNFEVQ